MNVIEPKVAGPLPSRNDASKSSNLRHAFVVMGAHRSGTSAMTRVLALSGLVLPAKMLPPQADNPAGFWEAESMVEINEHWLRAGGSAWDDVFSYDLRHRTSLLTEENIDTAATMLLSEFGGADAIVLKDPRLSLLVPLWDEALRQARYEPTYVIMVRNPLEVAASLSQRNGFSRGKSLMLWLAYLIAAERDTRERNRVFVSYEDLIENPLAVLDRIERASKTLLPRRSDAAADEIKRFIGADLRHHRVSRNALMDSDGVWLAIKKIYTWFGSASADNARPFKQLDDAVRRLDEMRLVWGELVAEYRLGIESLSAVVAAERLSGEAALATAKQEAEHHLSHEVAAWADRQKVFEDQAIEVEADRLRVQDELRSAQVSIEQLNEAHEALSRVHAQASTKLAERSAALESADIEIQHLEQALALAHDHALAGEVERAELAQTLAQQEKTLQSSDTERRQAEDALRLTKLHVETGDAERSRLHAALAAVRNSAEERMRQMAAQHEAAKAEDIAGWEKAIGRWEAERSALMRLLTSRDIALSGASEQLQEQQAVARTQVIETAAQLQSEKSRRGEAEAALTLASRQLGQIFQSRSWYVTKPLRGISRMARRVV